MVIVRELKNKKELDSACALLYNVYIEHMQWKFAENNPAGLRVITGENGEKLLLDNATPHAIWFGAFDAGHLVGCIRLLKARNNLSFELEHYTSAQEMLVKHVNPHKPFIYEAARACVDLQHKGKGILLKLYKAILEYAEQNRSSVYGSAAHEYIKSVLRKIEWPCKQEGAFKFEEADSAPVNFYLASYANGEIKRVIENIKHLLENVRVRKSLNIFDALNVVAPIFPAPIYWHDVEGRVLGANTICLTAMNRSKEQVLGKTPYDFYPKNIADYIWQHSKQVIESGEILSQEEYSYDKSGKQVGVYLAIKTPLYDDSHHCIGIMGTSIDITYQKELEQLRVDKAIYQNQFHAQELLKQCFSGMQDLLQATQNKLINGNKNNWQLAGVSTLAYKIHLSRREEQILYLLSHNKSSKDIANILGIIDGKELSYKTILSIINKKLYVKFEVFSVSELISKARSAGLIPFFPQSFVNYEHLIK